MAPIATDPSVDKAYIVTGPTSGFGRQTALELARHGTVILAGRDRSKLDDVQKAIERHGGKAVSVVCDLSDPASVGRAAARDHRARPADRRACSTTPASCRPARQNALGWDMTFATDHLGPFALTEALTPHLPDGAQVVFICSGVEDPERRPAVIAGFRGGRYISAEASARGEWAPGGSKLPGGTPTPRPSSATSRPCWCSRGRRRGCASTPSSPASARAPTRP